MRRHLVTLCLALSCTTAPTTVETTLPPPADPDAEERKNWRQDQETHLENVWQLTTEGDNGEAYFSPDGKQLTFQSKRGDHLFDQIYTMNLDGSAQTMISSGIGRTTCSYFTPDGKAIIYSSTHLRPETPPKPEGHGKEVYEWSFDTAFEVFRYELATKTLTQLTNAPGYDAEATFGLGGNKLAFASLRDGDAEIYVMNEDGSGQTRITNAKGYDGGPWLSPNGKQLVWRASRSDDYRKLELYLADADGKNARPLTQNGATNFAPSWHPSGDWIVFSSNMDEPRNFELYRIRPDGTGLERLTFQPGFDGFPVFSPDGKTLVFSSNRADPNLSTPGHKHATHVFRADWKD